MILNSDENKIADTTLQSLFTDKENCMRTTIITALGGTVEPLSSLCCMVCDPSGDTDGGRLDVLQVGGTPPRKKRRVAMRKVDEATMEHVRIGLKTERAKFIAEIPKYFRTTVCVPG